MVTISGGAGAPAALQANALALRQNQNFIDQIQLRLATGLRVNSAIDNPSNFFTASSLSNRAVNLNNVLDNVISQIGTIQEAGAAATSLTDLVEQAQTVAQNAQEVFTGSAEEAKITGDRSLTNVTDVPLDLAGVDNNDQLIFAFVDTDGSINPNNIVNINNGDSINDVINNINAIVDTGASQVFNASLNSAGQLEIKTADATRFEIDFRDFTNTADSQLAAALGFGDLDLNSEIDGAARTKITVLPTPAINSTSLFDASAGGTGALATTTLIDLTDTAGGAIRDIFDGDANDSIAIAVNGGTATTIISDISTATLQDFINGINNNGSLNGQIAASFGNGSLTIRAVDENVESIQFSITEDLAGAGRRGKIDLRALGVGARAIQSALDGTGNTSSENILLGSGVADLVNFENEFDDLRTQIDELVADSEFNGKNLLSTDTVTTVFNESGSSRLVTEGGALTSNDLGVSAANFGNSTNVDSSLNEISDALGQVERFSSSISNDISIIETRQDFIDNTINTLNANAQDLTVADSNDDGALLLALQARQQLGATGLAIAAQSLTTALRLF